MSDPRILAWICRPSEHSVLRQRYSVPSPVFRWPCVPVIAPVFCKGQSKAHCYMFYDLCLYKNQQMSAIKAKKYTIKCTNHGNTTDGGLSVSDYRQFWRGCISSCINNLMGNIESVHVLKYPSCELYGFFDKQTCCWYFSQIVYWFMESILKFVQAELISSLFESI